MLKLRLGPTGSAGKFMTRYWRRHRYVQEISQYIQFVTSSYSHGTCRRQLISLILDVWSLEVSYIPWYNYKSDLQMT